MGAWLTFDGWVSGRLAAAALVLTGLWASSSVGLQCLPLVLQYSLQLLVPPFRATSVLGLCLLILIYQQMYSGFLLALYYLPDPSYVITLREVMWLEVWWFGYIYKMHVVGVDLIFTVSYWHILNKLYLKNHATGDVDGWFTGAYAFLVYHAVVFLGITLSTNHLGDVTIMIAANIFWSLLGRWHKAYAAFFSNKHLSVDQLTRFMIAHYLSAWYYTYLVQTHVIFVHEMWDASANHSTQQASLTPKASWVWDALNKEVLLMYTLSLGLGILFFLELHPAVKPVDYSYFEQWGEAEMEEVNFFIVAPHWYFRAHMGLLTVCAHHYEGLAWLIGFYLILCYIPLFYRFWVNVIPGQTGLTDTVVTRMSPAQEALFVGLVSSIFYVGGTLPCGRFYYENIDGFFGNAVLRLAYEYIYGYLTIYLHLLPAMERSLARLPQVTTSRSKSRGR